MEELTKEQIQAEYQRLIPALGERTYRLLAPFAEVLNLAIRGIYLDQQMHQLRAKEEACQKDDTKLKVMK